MFRLCALHLSGRLSHAMCFIVCALLVPGCAQSDPAEMERLYREWSVAVDAEDSWIMAPDAEAMPPEEDASLAQASTSLFDSSTINVSKYWGTSNDTELVRLPCIDEAASAELIVPEMESLGRLLTPQKSADNIEAKVTCEPNAVVPGDCLGSTEHCLPEANAFDQEMGVAEPELDVPMPDPVIAQGLEKVSRAIELPNYEDLSSEERHLLELITRESLGATTGTLTDAQLDQECRIKISAAYALSQRGAAYAAREELIGVLRLISQAKDLRDDTRSCSESLAAGLRALEEARDFLPRGSQLEAEMKLEVICAAHRTPLARELNLSATLPSKMMERYHRYAQIKLAVAVAGEPAGSMALYSLGKLNSMLAATEGEQHPLAVREAVAFQQSALLAHNENYLAAHELGVLLAETGHFLESQNLLIQVAAEQPNAIVFRNLARVQDALGNRAEADLCRSEAVRLASLGRGSRPNISWVAPQDFSRGQLNSFAPQVASRPAAPIQSTPTVWR